MDRGRQSSAFNAPFKSKIISVFLAIVLALSMLDVTAFANDDGPGLSPIEQEIAATAERLEVGVNEAVVHFDCENSYAVFNNQVLTASDVKTVFHEEFTFQVKPDGGFFVDYGSEDAVKAKHALTEDEIPLEYDSEKDLYKIEGKYVDSYLRISTKATPIEAEGLAAAPEATPLVDGFGSENAETDSLAEIPPEDDAGDVEGDDEQTKESAEVEPEEGAEDLEAQEGETEDEAPAIAGQSLALQSAEGDKVVYWNPSRLPIKNPADDTDEGAPGNDENSGINKDYPVLTWEAVMKLIGNNQDWTVVVMTTAVAGLEETIDGTLVQVLPDNLVIDGGIANPTLIPWGGSAEDLFEVPLDESTGKSYSLTLRNVTLDAGAKSNAVRIIGADYVNQTVYHGAQLTIAENVLISGDIQTDLNEIGYSIDPSTTETKATLYDPILLTSVPPAGAKYSVSYSGIADNLSYLYVDVIDASGAGIDAKDYFTLSSRNTDNGWKLYWSLESKIGQGITEEDVDKTKLELYRDYTYTAIYLNGQTGNDANFGGTCSYPVKTFERAKQLLAEKMNGDGVIYVCDTVDVTSAEEWSLPIEDFPNARVVSCPDNSVVHNGSGSKEVVETLISISNGGSLTLSDITVDHGFATTESAAIVRIEGSGELTLNSGALLLDGWGTGRRCGSVIVATADTSGQVNITMNEGSAIQGKHYGIKAKGASASAKGGMNIVLNGGTISGILNDSSSYDSAFPGSAISAYNATVINNGATIQSGYSYQELGGLIFLDNSAFTMTDGAIIGGKFSNSSSKNKGGALYANASTLDISGGSFIGNSTSGNSSSYGYGGAIYTTGASTVNVSGTTLFEGNSAGYAGGALCFAGTTTPTISGTPVFRSNTQTYRTSSTSSPYGGGAIANLSSRTLSIKGGTFEQNEAAAMGGAIAHKPETSSGGLNISSATFANNKSYYDGGAIWGTTYLVISGGTFTENETINGNGGAVAQTTSSANIGSTSSPEPVVFERNKASKYGGAISAGYSMYISGATLLQDNTASTGGGAIYAVNTLRVRDTTTIKGNSATGNPGNGGAIFITGSSADLELSNEVIVSDNAANSMGGGIYVASGKASVRGSVSVSNNSATIGGGIASITGRTCIDGKEVTFTDNVASASVSQTVAEEERVYTQGSHLYIASCFELTGGTFTTSSTEMKDKDGAIFFNITNSGTSYYPYLDASQVEFNGNKMYLHTGLSKLWALTDPDLAAGSLPLSVNVEYFDIGSVVVTPIAARYITLASRTYDPGTDGLDVSKRSSVFEGGQIPEKTMLGGFNKNVIIIGEGVYLDGENGDDDNNGGTSPADAVKTYAKARELLIERVDEAKARTEGVDPASRLVFEPYIYICGQVTVDQDETWHLFNANDLADASLIQTRNHQPTPEIRRFASYYGNMVYVDGGASWMLEHAVMNGVCDAVAPSNTSATTSASGGVDPSITIMNGKAVLSYGAVVQNAFQHGIAVKNANATLDLVGDSVIKRNRNHNIYVTTGGKVTMHDDAVSDVVENPSTYINGRSAVYFYGTNMSLTLEDRSKLNCGTNRGVYSGKQIYTNIGYNVQVNMADDTLMTGTSSLVYLSGGGVLTMTGASRIENVASSSSSAVAVELYEASRAYVGKDSTEDYAPTIYSKAGTAIKLYGPGTATEFNAYGYALISGSNTGSYYPLISMSGTTNGGPRFNLTENSRVTGAGSSSVGCDIAGIDSAYTGSIFNATDNAIFENFGVGFKNIHYKNAQINFSGSARLRNCTYGISNDLNYSGSGYPTSLKVNFEDSAAIEDCNTGIYLKQSGSPSSGYGAHIVTFSGDSKITYTKGGNSGTAYMDYGSGSTLNLKDNAEISNMNTPVYVSVNTGSSTYNRDGGALNMSGNASIRNNANSGFYLRDEASRQLAYSVKLSDSASIENNNGYGIYGGFKTKIDLGAGTSVVNNASSLSAETLGRSIYSQNDVTLDVAASIDDELYLATGNPYLITLKNARGIDSTDKSLEGRFLLGYAKAYIGEKVVGPDGAEGAGQTTVADATAYFGAFQTKNIPEDKGEIKNIDISTPYIVVDGGRDVYIAGKGSASGIAPGNDSNNGESNAAPVATFERAKELLENKKPGARIIICNYSLSPTGENVWAFDDVVEGEAGYVINKKGESWKPIITRDTEYSGSLFSFSDTGANNTFRNLTFDATEGGNENMITSDQFYASYGTSASFESVVFQNFKAGVMFNIYYATFDFKDIVVKDCELTTSYNDRGLFWYARGTGRGTFENASFENNTLSINAARSALIMGMNTSTTSFKNASFSGNVLTARGTNAAMVLAQGSSEITFEESSFNGNTVTHSGTEAGLITAHDLGHITLTSSMVRENDITTTTSSVSGTLFAYSTRGSTSTATITLNGSQVEDNRLTYTGTSSRYGGWVTSYGGRITLNDSKIQRNTTTSSASVEYGPTVLMYPSRGPVEFNMQGDSSISDNHLTMTTTSRSSCVYGGAIAVVSSSYTKNVQLNGGMIARNSAEHSSSSGTVMYGAGLYDGASGATQLQGTSFIGNVAPYCDYLYESSGGALYLTGGTKVTVTGGQFSENQATKGSAVYLTGNAEILLGGGTFGGNLTNPEISVEEANKNAYSAIYVASSKFGLRGGRAVVDDRIYLSKKDYSVTLYGSIYQKSRLYKIDVPTSGWSNEIFSRGDVVVKPDGDVIANATSYHRYFEVTTPGYVLAKQYPNLVLKSYAFLDSTNPSETRNGSTPETAFRSLAEAKAYHRDNVSNMLFYVSGPMIMNEDTTWSLTETRINGELSSDVIRYTGFSVTGSRYDAYAGDLITVEEGTNFDIYDVNLMGKRDSDTFSGGSLIYVKKGATLNIGEGATLSENSSEVNEGTTEVNASQGRGGAVFSQGIVTMKESGASIMSTNALRGAAIYLDADARLELDQSPQIVGSVYLGGTTRNAADEVKDNAFIVTEQSYEPPVNTFGQTQRLSVDIQNPYNGREVVDYVDPYEPGTTQKEYYKLSPSIEALYKFNNRVDDLTVLELQKKNIIYVDGVDGNDSEDGSTPARAVYTLSRAYEIMKDREDYTAGTSEPITGGLIYVVNTVSIGEGAEISARNETGATASTYSDNSGSAAIELHGMVSVRRYVQPDAYDPGYSDLAEWAKPTLKDPLFDVLEGGSLSFEAFDLDGHAQSMSGDERFAAAGAEVDAALVRVSGGTFFDDSGKYADNANTAVDGFGGAFDIQSGVAQIRNTTIQDTSAAFGSAIYQGGLLKIASGNSYINGDIYLEGAGDEQDTSSSKYIESVVWGVQNNGSTGVFEVTVADPYRGRQVVQFPEGGSVQASDRSKFKLDEITRELFSLGNRKNAENILELQARTGVYIDGVNGSDANTGLTPEESVKSLDQAYQVADKYEANVLYVVDTVTISQSQTISSTYYAPTEYDGETDLNQISGVKKLKRGALEIRRYAQPDDYASIQGGGFDVVSNTKVLFDVANGNFIINELTIDGHKKSLVGEAIPETMKVSEGLDSHDPLITVSGKTAALWLSGGAFLQNNKNVTTTGEANHFGGAVSNFGTTYFEGAWFVGNEAAKGSGIYQQGTLNIDDIQEASLEGHEVYLGSEGEGDNATNHKINVRTILPKDTVIAVNMDNAVRLRDVAQFTDGAIENGAGKLNEERDHFALGSTVPSELKAGVSPTEYNTIELQGDVDITYEVVTFDRLGNDVSDRYSGGSLSSEGDRVFAVDTAATPESIATAQSYYVFDGWFYDEACTQAVDNRFFDAADTAKVKILPQMTAGTYSAYFTEASFYARFTEEYVDTDNMVGIDYSVRTVDRDGKDRSDSYTGGTVDNAQDKLSVVTGKTIVGADPSSTASTHAYYTFLGWYSADAFVDGILDDSKQITENLELEPAMDPWLATEYFAVFQEEIVDTDNMIELQYMAKTVDKDGVDRSADYTGGSVDPGQEAVSIITGKTPEGSAAGSVATTEQYYRFAGWYSSDAFDGGALDEAKLIGVDEEFIPEMTSWIDAEYLAIFIEETDDEDNIIKIDYVAKTVDKEGNDAPEYVGGSVDPSYTTVSIITGEPQTATASANDYYHFIGWYRSYDAATVPAYTDQVESDEIFEPAKPSSGWSDASYYALFQEITDDDDKMVTIDYRVKTLDRNGEDVSDSFTGGEVSNDQDKVSVVSADGLEGSTATAHQYYFFVGWQDAYGNVITEQEALTPERPTSGWTRASYTAVFQEDPDSLATLSYVVRTVDRDGNDVSSDYVGGTVDPAQEKVSFVSGKTPEGENPQSLAEANKYYRFIGWYSASVLDGGVLDSNALIQDDALLKPQMSQWQDAEYVAIFQEEFNNEENMISLTYEAKTINSDGEDISETSVGGTVSNEVDKISIITGKTVDGANPGSTAIPAEKHVHVGWYHGFSAKQGRVSYVKSMAAEGHDFTPVKPQGGWQDASFEAVFNAVDEPLPPIVPVAPEEPSIPEEPETPVTPIVPTTPEESVVTEVEEPETSEGAEELESSPARSAEERQTILDQFASGIESILAAPVEALAVALGALAETSLDDDKAPLAQGERALCWVHWYILLGILLTTMYSAGVVVRRRKRIKAADKYEMQIMKEGPVNNSEFPSEDDSGLESKVAE